VKVFLDANVLASALATRGLCADVMREVLASHELLVSDELIAEPVRTMQGKFLVPTKILRELESFLRREAVVLPPAEPAGEGLRDEADRRHLGAALAGGADLLITGDKDLQRVRRIVSLKILSPRQFWELLRA
jgi:putative PIN family toxin of toxin-antitoxin system